MIHAPFNGDVTPTRTATIRAMRVKQTGDPQRCPFSHCGAPGAVRVRWSDEKNRMEAFCRSCGDVLPGDGGPTL